MTVRKSNIIDRAAAYASIQKAFDVLEYMASVEGPQGVTGVAAALGLEKSSVSGLMKLLTEMGYLVPGDGRGQYELGPRVLVLARSFLEHDPLIRESQAILADLAVEARASAHLGIIVDGEAIVVAKAPSPEFTQVGARIPAHASALGKVLLASLDDDRVDTVLSQKRKRYTKNTIVERRKLQAAIRDVREAGYALEMEEEHVGVGCVGAPVVDHAGRWIAALSIARPLHGTPFGLDDT